MREQLDHGEFFQRRDRQFRPVHSSEDEIEVDPGNRVVFRWNLRQCEV